MIRVSSSMRNQPISKKRRLTGCCGRALGEKIFRNRPMSGSATSTRLSMTIHSTVCEQGGVVREPSYLQVGPNFSGKSCLASIGFAVCALPSRLPGATAMISENAALRRPGTEQSTQHR